MLVKPIEHIHIIRPILQADINKIKIIINNITEIKDKSSDESYFISRKK